MFKIIKKGNNNFWHVFNNGAKNVSISDFEVVLDDVLNTFVIVLRNGANIPQIALSVLDIVVIDETDSSVEETFLTASQLRARLVVLGYTAYLGAGNADSITGLIDAGTNVTITGTGTLSDPYVISSSGGSGTTPTLQEVVIEGDEIINTAGNLKIVLDKEVNGVVLYELVSGTWEEKGCYTSSDFQVGVGTGNYYILGSEFTGFSISQGTDIVQLTSNSITKNGFEVVTEVPYTWSGSDVIFDKIVSLNELRIKNPGGILAVLKSDNLTDNRMIQFQDIPYIGVADITDIPDVSNFVVKNTSITGATKTKITYDSKGLVTNGADATTNDIADSTDKRYQTDAQRANNDAISSIQTQLNNKQPLLSYTPYKFIQVSDTPHTGTTAETILATATIPSNTFPSTEVLEALFGVNKTGTGGAYTIRLKINTSNTLSGATTIATFTAGSNTVQWTLMSRSFSLLSGNLRGYPFTTSQVNDVMNIGGTLGSTAYNTANTLYMFWCVTLVNAGDSITPNLCNLTNN